jgi:hypothetical protein
MEQLVLRNEKLSFIPPESAVIVMQYLSDVSLFFQVMESQSMIYIVSEYASQGEIFGKFFILKLQLGFVLEYFTVHHDPNSQWELLSCVFNAIKIFHACRLCNS